MDYLWDHYDSTDFFGDHHDEFLDEGEDFEPDHEMTARVYEYPGGPENANLLLGNVSGEPLPISFRYTDESGREWGYIGYFYGYFDWICLDDPESSFEELWPDGAPEIDKRERVYYEVVYNEDSTEVREMNSPDETIVESTTTGAETTVEESETSTGETEEYIFESPEPQNARTPFNRLTIAGAIIIVVAVSAGIVLIILFKHSI